jgi:hypothetical protein
MKKLILIVVCTITLVTLLTGHLHENGTRQLTRIKIQTKEEIVS